MAACGCLERASGYRHKRPAMRNGLPMRPTRSSASRSFDEKIFELLDGSWRTVGEIHRLLGGGEAPVAAMTLDRLWKAGRIEKDDGHIIVGPGRKGGGGELRFLKFRRKFCVTFQRQRSLNETLPAIRISAAQRVCDCGEGIRPVPERMETDPSPPTICESEKSLKSGVSRTAEMAKRCVCFAAPVRRFAESYGASDHPCSKPRWF